MLTVLQVTTDMERGGVPRIVTRITSHLTTRGCRVLVAAPPGPMENQVEGPFIPMQELASRHPISMLIASSRLRSMLDHERVDIVHVHQRRAALIAQIAAANRPIQIVEHVHSLFGDNKLLSFRSRMLIAVGTVVRDRLVRHYGRSPDRVEVVFNGVPASAAATRDQIDGRPLSVLGVGRLVPEKDPAYFANFVAGLKAAVPVEATWIGDGPLMYKMSAEFPDVRWYGFASDPSTFLSRADVVVSSSTREGLPLSLLEAIAAGCAVVARDAGSVRDIVRNDWNGLLFPQEVSPDNAAKALIAKSQRFRRLQLWGANGRALHLERFTEESMVDGVERVYAKVRPGAT